MVAQPPRGNGRQTMQKAVTKATDMTTTSTKSGSDELASPTAAGVPLGLVLLTLVFPAAAAAVLAGCQRAHDERDDRVSGLTFQPEDETRATRRFAAVQIAAGARTDATL